MRQDLSIGKIYLLIISLSLLLLSISSVRAQTDSEAGKQDLNGLWSLSTTGLVVEVRQEGDSVIGIIKKSKNSDNIGLTDFQGTLTGNKFQGKTLVVSKECPELDSLIDAVGTISDNKIILTSDQNIRFDSEKCEILNETSTITFTYIRIQESTPSPEPVAEVNENTGSDVWPGFDKQGACEDAVWVKYEKEMLPICRGVCKEFFWYGCMYNPDGASPIDAYACVKNNFPALKAELDECERRFSSKPEETPPASDPENSKNENSIIDFGVINGELSENYDSETAAMAMELVRSEFEKARSDLEKIKQSGDSRWEDKKNFADERNAKINKALADASPDEADRLKEINLIVRTVGESGRDLLTTVQDVKDYYTEYRKTGSFGEYGGMGIFSDTAGGVTDFLDMIDKGTSAKVAITKTVLDNYGVSLLNSIPALKVWDIAASSPDKVLKSLGISEKNWSRKATIAVGEVSPSGVIKKTTKLMQENNWSNIGDALGRQLGKVRSAKGVENIAVESFKLVAGTIGAVPVSAARLLSDTVGGTIFMGQKTVNFVYNWFTD